MPDDPQTSQADALADKSLEWASAVPIVRLSSDQLPKNPERVIRTFAADLATMQEPMRSASKPEQKIAPAPRAATSATNEPPPNLPGAGGQPPAMNNARPIQESSTPGIPPVKKPLVQPPPLPVKTPGPTASKPPERLSADTFEEGIVHEKKPSMIDNLVKMVLGDRDEEEAMQHVLPAITPVPRVTGDELPIEDAVPSAQASEDATEREAVLARLRGRVASYTPAQQASTPPVFPTPKPEGRTIPRPLPQALPRQGASTNPDLERLRTFSSDFASESDRASASTFSILAAQADAARPTPLATQDVQPAPQGHRGLAYALIATVLFVGGSLLLYFGFSFFATHAPVSVNSSAPASLIQGDDSTTITGSGGALMGALANIASNSGIPVGNIRIAYLLVASTTGNGTPVNLTRPGGDLIAALQLPAPSALLRNMNEDSTVGIVNANNETWPFFILDMQAYDPTFAAMLAWEPTMGSNLARIYPSYASEVPIGSSTPPVGTEQFVDEIVESHDVRALKDSYNRTVLIYGYADQSTLIIARDENAFTTILNRLSATAGR